MVASIFLLLPLLISRLARRFSHLSAAVTSAIPFFDFDLVGAADDFFVAISQSSFP